RLEAKIGLRIGKLQPIRKIRKVYQLAAAELARRELSIRRECNPGASGIDLSPYPSDLRPLFSPLPTAIRHSRMTAICSWIRSNCTKFPFPLPGQTLQVSSQASLVRRFECQKGQVRHCRGRAP